MPSHGARLVAAEPQLFVADMATALDFHVGRLGFAVVFQYGEPTFYTQIARDGARLNLRLVHGPVFDSDFRLREADALACTITVHDAAALFREFQAASVTFHQPLRRESWGSDTFIVADPDGNLLAFASAG